MLRLAYNLLLWLSLPALALKLWWRGLREPGYRDRIGERFGLYRDKTDEQCRDVIWVHAVSMGETRASALLVRMLVERFPSSHILVTHMTATGRQAATELFSGIPNAHIAWLPYDYPFAVRSFIQRYRPRLAILMETEIWPNLIGACKAFGMPVMLANARMSEKSARGYLRLGSIFLEVFASLDSVLAQSAADAERLRKLGVPPSVLVIVGNLKFDVAMGKQPHVDQALRGLIGPRPVFLAASTREGEEALILDALALAENNGHGLPPRTLVIIVPRHPQRFDAVADLLKRRSVSFVRRSSGVDVPGDCGVMLGDTIGEMPAYYGVADCAFIGGSLLPLGGQNLIEACAAGVPVLIGLHTFNFSDAADQAVTAGAAVRVASASELITVAAKLLVDSEKRERMGESGRIFCRQYLGATAKTIKVVEQMLNRKN